MIKLILTPDYGNLSKYKMYFLNNYKNEIIKQQSYPK